VSITVGSPVLPDGSLSTLVIGDDYKATNGRALSWILNTSIVIASCRIAFYQNGARQMAINGTVSVLQDQTQRLSFDITAENWAPMTNGDAEYNVEMRDAANNEITIVHSFIAGRKVRLIHKYT
jgi:hypothetical protein